MKTINLLLIYFLSYSTFLQAQNPVNTWVIGSNVPNNVEQELWGKWKHGFESIDTNFTNTYKNLSCSVRDNYGNIYWASNNQYIIKNKSVSETGIVVKTSGKKWSKVGGGVQGTTVSAMVLDSVGNLYVAGIFTKLGSKTITTTNTIVVKWDGTNWTQIGNDIVGSIQRISIHENNQLYICGKFTVQNSSKPKYLATWNGTAWVGFGEGLNGLVTDITINRDGLLFATGSFQSSGNGQTTAEKAVKYVAVWDGLSWQPLPGGTIVKPSYAENIYFYNDKLYLLGTIASINGTVVGNKSPIVQYTFPKESDLGFNGRVLSMTNDIHGNIYVGGSFSEVGSTVLNNIAKWDGTKWTALGAGLEGDVYTMTVDKYGNLYAGGKFNLSGNTKVNHVAKWDGTNWTALSTGLDSNCHTLATDGKYLYVGGMFNKAGGQPAKNIARWDLIEHTWSSLGTGLNSYCYALAFDNRYYLYTGGSFSTAGDTAVNSIARWNTADAKWEKVGDGLSNGDGCYTLAFDKYYNLYAGGIFQKAGSTSVKHIAKWDDRASTWSTISGTTDSISASVINVITIDDEGNVYFAGGLFKVGSQATSYAGYWDKDLKTWNVIDSTVNGEIDTMLTDGYYFYYGGNFVEAFGTDAYYFVRRFIE